MNENKNQHLAREITGFCKERLRSSSMRPKGARSLLQTALASFLALVLVGGGVDSNRGPYWQE